MFREGVRRREERSVGSTDAQLNLFLECTPTTLTLRRNLTGSSANIQWSWSPALKTWYHIAIVRYGSSLKLYVNGQLDRTNSSPSGEVVDPVGNRSMYFGFRSLYLLGFAMYLLAFLFTKKNFILKKN